MGRLQLFLGLVVSLHGLVGQLQGLLHLGHLDENLVELLNLLLGMRGDLLNISLDLEDVLSHLIHLRIDFLHEGMRVQHHSGSGCQLVIEELLLKDMELMLKLLELLALYGNISFDDFELLENVDLLDPGPLHLIQFEHIHIFVDHVVVG